MKGGRKGALALVLQRKPKLDEGKGVSLKSPGVGGGLEAFCVWFGVMIGVWGWLVVSAVRYLFGGMFFGVAAWLSPPQRSKWPILNDIGWLKQRHKLKANRDKQSLII